MNKTDPEQMSQLTIDDDGAAESENDEESASQPKELPEYACR